MSSRSLAMDQFLGHQTRTGGHGQFLSGWRKKNPPKVDVVLHRKAPIVALWQHGHPRVVEVDDKKTKRKTQKVWSGQFNCLENEAVLVKQFKRDKSTGDRAVPPVLCPFCRLNEALHVMWRSGEVKITDEVFRWEGGEETQSLTVGGMLNLYGKDDLSEEDKADMDEVGVSLSEAWKENTWSKCNYMFCVVDTEDVEAGVQIAVETTGLGDKVKEVIHDQMTSLGDEDGNPLVKPYVLRWEHHPNASEFQKKYKAIAMRKIVITPEVQKLIDGDPPDIEGVIKPGNITKLRAELESHCVLEDPNALPWDVIFGPAEKAGYGQDPESESEDEDEDEDEASTAGKVAEEVKATRAKLNKPEPEPAKEEPAKRGRKAAAAPAKTEPAPVATESAQTRRRRVQAPEPEPEPEPEPVAVGEEKIPCDECGYMMLASATTCEKCGAEYAIDDDGQPEPEPAKTTPKATPAVEGSKKTKLKF